MQGEDKDEESSQNNLERLVRLGVDKHFNGTEYASWGREWGRDADYRDDLW